MSLGKSTRILTFIFFTTEYNEMLFKYFRNNEIDLIYIDGINGPQYYQADGHPTAKANKIISEKVFEYLKKDLEITQYDE